MTEENQSTSSVDKWRRLLEDAERELEEKTHQWQHHERELCGAISKISRLVPAEGPLETILLEIREAVKDGFEPQRFQQAMACFADAIRNQTETALGPGAELRRLLKAVRLPPEQDKRLRALLDGVRDQESLLAAIDEIAALWRQVDRSAAAPGPEQDRICAMMVAEILLQLMERLSLPKELQERTQRLRQGLESGLEMEAWMAMLEEIADMVAAIRRRINRERQETETFLKALTERLDELDRYMQGNEDLQRQAQDEDQRLNAAVKRETDGLRASIAASQDLDVLKQEINQRLEAISAHLDHHRMQSRQRAQQGEENQRDLRAKLARLEKESAALRARVHKERRAAMEDALTGIGNRLAYEERMRIEFARWKRYGKPLSLLVWDVDHFKQINDKYGHQAGDKALKSIAKIFSAKVRESDFFARYGGEEFVLIMPSASQEHAVEVAEQLRRAVARTAFHFQGKPVTITASCGVASFAPGDTPESVFGRADKALYQAKQQGRNRVVASGDEANPGLAARGD